MYVIVETEQWLLVFMLIHPMFILDDECLADRTLYKTLLTVT